MKMSWAGTVIVLVGKKTYTRPWVNWEIEQAHKQGKNIFGVYEHGLILQRNISLHLFSKGIGFLTMGFIRTQIATQMVLNDLHRSLNGE
jgi:hypothetical protein